MSGVEKLVKIMKIGGQWNCPSDGRVIRSVRAGRQIFDVAMTCLSIVAIYVSGLKRNLGLVMFASVIGGLTSGQSCYFYLKSKKAMEIIKMYGDMFETHRFKWETDLIHKSTKFVWGAINFYHVNGVILIFGYLVLPVMIDTMSIVIPSFKGFRIPLPLEGFLDPDPARDTKYYVVTITAILWASGSIMSSLGIQAILCSFCSFQSSEVAVFCEKLRIFARQEEKMYLQAEIDVEKTEKKLIQLVINQQMLINAAQEINDYLGFPFALQNTLISGCICLLMYSCITQTSDIALYITVIFCLMVMFGLSGYDCFMGQSLENQSLQIFETLYEIPWYEQSPDLRKYMNMMLRQSSRHMKINFHGRSPLNYQTLMQIMNTSYTYFMLLKSLF